jgi:polyhydroxyalkanoate synthesis regulator phasin
MAGIKDEIVETVVKKGGLTKEQANKAVDITLEILKKKLPAPIAAQMDGALSGKMPDLGQAGDVLGGLLGGKKK